MEGAFAPQCPQAISHSLNASGIEYIDEFEVEGSSSPKNNVLYNDRRAIREAAVTWIHRPTKDHMAFEGQALLIF